MQTNRFSGVNLGSWFLMEGYILGGENFPEHKFKERFKSIYGSRGLDEFEKLFRTNYVTRNDIKIISESGANCIRVPFNYRLIEKAPFKYSREGVSYLKRLFRWAGEFNLKVILDLHAAPGGQNSDWHSDSTGKALLWKNRVYRNRTYALWEYLADTFKKEISLSGYDLLNEPVVNKEKIGLLKDVYASLIKIIRGVDKEHIIFLEGHSWAQEIDFLGDLIGDNIWVSIHAYQPINFTFNLRPGFRYPGLIDGKLWNKDRLREYFKKYIDFSRKFKVPVLVGEFGVNYRGGYWGELKWVRDVISIFKESNFSWTYWTYKAVANRIYPDGLYQYLDNSSVVQRQGPVYGWENYYSLWKKDKKDILHSWKTENFTANKLLINLIKKYL